jgi:hypothetical protein
MMKNLSTHGNRIFSVALLGFLFLLAITAQAATLTVSTTNDSGAGSLRQAITNANMTFGLDTIVFSIPGGGVKTITPASPLPTVTQPLIIDGTSQPGFSGTPLIELNGTAAGAHANGLKLTGGTSWVKGLVINRFGRVGVVIEGPGQTTVSGCYIGTNAAGSADLGNGEDGVLILNSSNNLIGGTTADRRNIISGNAAGGISIEQNLPSPSVTLNNIIRGNRIGTNAAGTAALPNFIGVRLDFNTFSTLIGGTVAGAGNLISGNSVFGIYTAPVSDSHTIQGNYIGTDVTGNSKLGNGDHGIQCISSNNIIGGSTPAAANVISGNLNSGLRLGQQGSGNQVKGNLIGTGKLGGAVGNSNYGVIVQEQTNSQIGGTADGEGNVIAFNPKGGIRVMPGDHVAGATGNALLRNRIYANEHGFFNPALGIDIGPEGVTANDLKDPDTGANELQNFPLVTSVERDLSSTIFKGSLNSKANTEYRIEFFRNQTCDYSGNGEGQFYVGAINSIITNVNGNANFNIAMPLILLPIGEFVSATATDSAGNTSEFSPCTPIGAKTFGTFMVMTDVQFVKETAGSAFVTLYRAGGTTGAVSMNYATSNVTATAPGDYTPKSGTLNFAEGQTSATVEIPIFNDGDPEGDEVIDLTFSNPTGSAAVGFIGPVHVHIVDNDSNPDIIEFSAGNYTVTENGVFLEVVVKKLGTFNNSSVTFQASNGTATVPNDYTAPSGVITFTPFEFTKTVFVTIFNDTMDEANETINLTLSNPDAAVLGPNSTAVITITDNDAPPAVSVGDVSIIESNSGTVNAVFPLTLSAASGLPINVNFATANATASSGSDYQGQSSLKSFAPGEVTKSISIPINGDPDPEGDETFLVNLLGAENATIADGLGTGTIINDDTPAGPSLAFSQATYNIAEQLGAVTVTVTRTGDTTAPATVDYTTSDTSATQKSDFEITSGTLNFAAGEVSKTVKILINQDMYIEGNEGFNVVLSNPSGIALGAQSTTNITITDDLPESVTNPIDDPQSFVHTHYHDFLNREPDAAGLQFWTNEIASCGTNAQCVEVKRVNVSAAYFLSIEFQQTGYLLYLMQKESFNSLAKYASFMRDLQEVSQGVMVNSPGWQQKLALNQQQFAEKWANRPEFLAVYGGMSNTAFVNTLYTNAGVVPSDAERNALINALNAATLSRGGALLEVTNNSMFRQQERNPAFVLMQYFGYLRRDPDSGPDTDLSGFFFWLNKLNSFNGDYQAADMVKAFITSGEYRQRFGQ